MESDEGNVLYSHFWYGGKSLLKNNTMYAVHFAVKKDNLIGHKACDSFGVKNSRIQRNYCLKKLQQKVVCIGLIKSKER